MSFKIRKEEPKKIETKEKKGIIRYFTTYETSMGFRDGISRLQVNGSINQGADYTNRRRGR